MRGLWSLVCTAIGSFLLGFTIVMFLVPPLRSIPAEILVEDDRPTRNADAIILLMGDAMDRAPHAAQLLKDEFGKKIVFVETEVDELVKAGVRTPEGRMVYEYLTKGLKVPADKIVFDSESRVSSTQEEARALLKILDRENMKRSTLVTSWYHSSRAAWIFRKVLAEENQPKIQLESFPSPTPRRWYEREKDFLNVYMEYLKWAYYYVKYDLLS